MSDEVRIAMSIPLDSDGFVRRQCPSCERQLKFRVADDAQEPPDDEPQDWAGYFCPYCGIQAPPQAWHTEAQLEHAQALVAREAMGPIFDRFEGSGFKVTRNLPPQPSALSEDDDMRRVEFACHPEEPIKVLDDWSDPVRCILCGTLAGS